MDPTVLTIPGLGGSGTDHWQSIWEQRYGYTRVEQSDWERPGRDAWVSTLERAVAAATGPVILVAHSLGCAAVAHLAGRKRTSAVKGALLVAPADVDSPLHTPDEARCFSPLPLEPLPFRSILVASRTDPYIRFARAEEIAKHWGARFVDTGRAGHLNADSGFGEWAAGHSLLEELRCAADAP